MRTLTLLLSILVCIQFTSCGNNSSDNNKSQIDTTSAETNSSTSETPKSGPVTLNKCTLTFGIPGTTSDYDGNNILFTTVTVYVGNNKYTARQEFRNQPIGAGHAVYLDEPFSNADKAKINPNTIDKIEFTIAINQGNGNQQVRAEAVLQFNDGTIIATGYPDPAPSIFIKGGPSGPKSGSEVYTFPKVKPFFNKATLIEPIN